MIEVKGLRKSYGSLTAVDGVSFVVRKGETFGLLGPNGAGKTTTILMLVGAVRADEGEVAIDGASDPTRADVRRNIGIAPQTLSLYPELTGLENLQFFGRLYGLAGGRLAERTDWALSFSGLADRRNDAVRKYSGGMQRRLNLACALIHDPPVLLLDEPTVGVDPQSRNHMFANIEQLRKDGRTVLYTTHYMEEAERLCDHVAIIDHGKILDLDTVDELIERHGGKSVVEGEVDGEEVRIETDAPVEEAAKFAGRKIRSLHIHRPNLEKVFLTLTGRSLRD